MIVLWLVVVLAASVWAGLRGRRFLVTARAAQSDVQRHIVNAELEQLPERLAELEARQERLAEAVARLQASIAEFRVLWQALTSASGRLTSARTFFTSK
jgi:chromosome segregation ATPase